MTNKALQPLSADVRKALRLTLEQRLADFSRAMASGGRRESYSNWQASRTALAAAVEILAVSGE